ncbi:MAG: heavy metal translocating P-type ATPase [Burkholderiaceae bacterium]|mgnify:CR=1 FL=1|nr:heavy metal translocating P-type ATPase [Burkholderiaceae bacterium]MDO9260059.1 heavy metal translocating P-type ATPase [Polaromonas sp.]
MSEPIKLRLDLPLVLPHVDNVEDRCVARLIASLSGRPGISEAHVAQGQDHPPQLCIHYIPSVISLTRVRELVSAAGAALNEQYAHVVISAPPLHARAARRIAEALRDTTGVFEADVSASGTVRIEYDRRQVSASDLRAKAAALGIGNDKRDRDLIAAAAEDKPKPHSHPGHSTSEQNHSHEHRAAAPETTPTSPPITAADEQLPSPGGEPPLGAEDHSRHDHKHGDTSDHAEHDHAHGGMFGEQTELIFAALAGLLLLGGWLVERSGASPSWLPTAFYVVAYLFGGFYTVKEAVENLRARRFEIDTLMLVAAVGAAALGKWAEGALLLFLFSLGHSLEHYAMGRARKAIEALAKLAPEVATVRRENGTEEIGVGKLQVGDVVIVRPNERLPADGVVVVGTSSVNQAPVTGESVPVDKSPITDAKAALSAFDRVGAEHRVFAGTINGSGAIEVMVARRSEQSTMARVVKMVTEAEAQRSPTQQFTEKFERIFVPAVLALVVLLMFAGLVIDEPFSATFYRAMAVLVAASPCALAISVPSAVLSGVARAGRGGVLVKGGGPLENLGTLTSIAFDKTGTLTEGKPKLTDAVAMDGVSDDELLSVALAVEQQSDHPLAGAIVNGARERLGGRVNPPAVTDVKSITGRGVQALVDGQQVHIGKPSLFDELKDSALPAELVAVNDKLVAAGRTTMVVRKGTRFLGVIAVMDTPRPAAAQVMAELRSLGIERLIMISGDNQKVAEAVAKSVGLTEARGDLMPEQKVQEIKALREKHGKVAMVGDGVNDAPAMANATVGIAMGAAGSDVALETADVALMADDLAQLPFAVGLSRSTSRIIRQNLFVSLGVVAVLIPATIFGLNIGTAVLFHEGSTVMVVANALRLLAYNFTSSANKEA